MTRWLALHVGGQMWGVYLVSPRSKYLAKGSCVGSCFYDTCKIYLSRTLENGALEEALLHELLHALLYVTGAESAYNADAAADEHVVAALTPSLHRLLKDLSFQFPTRR